MNWLLALLVAGPRGQHASTGAAVIFAVIIAAMLLGAWR